MAIRSAICFISLFLVLLASAQEDEIRRRQRAIFLYNFTQQIGWKNVGEIERFTIGVMGEDQVVEELNDMQKEGRTVRGKPLAVTKFNSISDVEDVQLIYANNRFNFDIAQLLQHTSGKNILVVSEGYGFNESMINMIDIGDSFQFEINQTRLNQEGFSVSSSLKLLAITSATRWQELYLESSKSLQEEREKVAEQREILEGQEQLLIKQNAKITEQIQQIDSRNVELERIRKDYQSLAARNKEQEELYQQKVQDLAVVEGSLDAQRKEIAQRKDDIASLDSTLNIQREQSILQTQQIEEQLAVLRKQRTELNYQRNFTLLFVILTFLTITAGFFIWRSYRIKKKSNEELAEKNEAIEAQAKELAIQNEEMEQFAYVASHDLQEPLNTITSIANLVEKDQLDEMGKKSLQFIVDSTDRMRQLIRGLLEYSQLGRDIEFAPVDFNVTVYNVQANLGKIIEDTNAVIHVGKLPVLQAHETEIALLFQNLISNALKFRREGVDPIINIKAKEVTGDGKHKWRFEVKDNGIGIAPEYQEKIFAIFQRLHSKSKYEGAGIGLAHCWKIVELHGGTLWVESELGKGSTFFFTIET